MSGSPGGEQPSDVRKPSKARPKLLQARSSKVAFEAVVGKTQLVQEGSGAYAQAGFYCSCCDKLCKDNVTFLDHINSAGHLQKTGHVMEIKRSTVDEVRARIRYHQQQLHEPKPVYSLEQRTAEVKAISQQKRAEKKAMRRAAKVKRACLDPLADSEEASEYSDYEIDEKGNIIETPKESVPTANVTDAFATLMGFAGFGTTKK